MCELSKFMPTFVPLSTPMKPQVGRKRVGLRGRRKEKGRGSVEKDVCMVENEPL